MRESKRLAYDDPAAAGYLLAQVIEHVPRAVLLNELAEANSVVELIPEPSVHRQLKAIIEAELLERDLAGGRSNISPGQLDIDDVLADTWRHDVGAGHPGDRRGADGPGGDPARSDGTRTAEAAQWPDDTGYGG